MESNDFSPLAPMTVQDLIWVHAAQSLKRKREVEYETRKFEVSSKNAEYLYLAVCDLRALLLETHFYTKVHALKVHGTKSFDVSKLPSNEKAEEERRAKITPEEREQEDLQAFLSGKKTIRA